MVITIRVRVIKIRVRVIKIRVRVIKIRVRVCFEIIVTVYYCCTVLRTYQTNKEYIFVHFS
jgi:hypothetical protein